ncbi:MAG: DUF4159 domain-containing protein [Planctomycetota bacterium]|nr:DUF4159 domain-containing protein [Planctomycetota bacterium]MDP7252631.1 DUF4159 domain-containing protein [Planctomycetota bacterium]
MSRPINITGMKLGRPASFWVFALGMLCVSAAATLFPAGLMSYLSPFMGKGPAGHLLKTPVLVTLLGLAAFLVHCFSVLALGGAGWLILHRAWNPGRVWRADENDPTWFKWFLGRYNKWSRRPLSLAWRGTYLTIILAIFGWAYMTAGEAFKLPFEGDPDGMVSYYIYWMALFFWPATFISLSNIYSVKQHFLGEEIQLEEMVRPHDVMDLIHDKDAITKRQRVKARVKDRKPSAVTWLWEHRMEILIFILSAPILTWLFKDYFPQSDRGIPPPFSWYQASFYGCFFAFAGAFFLHMRTSLLRQHTSEIGHTDVQARWASQQMLRAYRYGDDPRYSESNGISFTIHFLLIAGPILLALLTGLFGCIDPYRIPLGGGDAPASPQKKQVKVIKKKRKFLVNPFSSIVFAEITPEMMDMELSEVTEHAYSGRRGGGRGKRGDPGFGGGEGGGAVRFIRIQHNGSDWDRNMKLNGDNQMLQEFHKRTNGIPIARKTESIRIDDIPKWKKDQSAPFLYITGRKSFSITAREARILKDYMINRGGFIIGDSPGEYFASSFTRMISRTLGPLARWVDIPNDDILYTCYYRLPRGAPPLWHHDGHRARGIKVKGRWVVFYHPGDLGDAWKIGHSGAKKDSVEMAYNMGVNLMYYAFTRYIDFHHKGKY